MPIAAGNAYRVFSRHRSTIYSIALSTQSASEER
jgi:hypothetical protein